MPRVCEAFLSKSCSGTDRVPLHIFRASPNALCSKATPIAECKRAKYPGYHKAQHFVLYSRTKLHFLILNVTRQREQVSPGCLCLFPRASQNPSAAVSPSTASPTRKDLKCCVKGNTPQKFPQNVPLQWMLQGTSEGFSATRKARWATDQSPGLPRNSEPQKCQHSFLPSLCLTSQCLKAEQSPMPMYWPWRYTAKSLTSVESIRKTFKSTVFLVVQKCCKGPVLQANLLS